MILKLQEQYLSDAGILIVSSTIQIPSIADRDHWKYNWFTDGSKNKEKAGAGVYRRRTGMGFTIPMGTHATVLQTEVIAVFQCAYKAQKHGNRRNIRIFSNSRAAIMALNGTMTTSLLVWECFEPLNNLATENRVTLLCIPGHSDIKGNEISDRLSVRESFTGPEPVVGVSSRLVTEEINSWLSEEYQKEWKGLLAVNRPRRSWAQLWTSNKLRNYASLGGTKSRS